MRRRAPHVPADVGAVRAPRRGAARTRPRSWRPCRARRDQLPPVPRAVPGRPVRRIRVRPVEPSAHTSRAALRRGRRRREGAVLQPHRPRPGGSRRALLRPRRGLRGVARRGRSRGAARRHGRRGRPGRAVLHGRHDRPVEGRDAHPPQPRGQRVALHGLLAVHPGHPLVDHRPAVPPGGHPWPCWRRCGTAGSRWCSAPSIRPRHSTSSKPTGSRRRSSCRRCSTPMSAEQDARPRDVSSLRHIGHGGSPIATDTLRRAHAAFPDAELVHLYGATETAPIATSLPHEERVLDGPRARSCGQPAIGVDVEVRRADAHRCRAGRGRRGRRSAART